MKNQKLKVKTKSKQQKKQLQTLFFAVCVLTFTLYISDRLFAAPENFQPNREPELPSTPLPAPPAPVAPIQQTPPPPPAPAQPLPISQPPAVTPENSPPKLTSQAERIAAQRAWQYFDRNWNSETGFVNSVDNYPWTTWWDQGSAIMGIHAAYQLQLIDSNRFDRMISRLLQTLETLPLPTTRLPDKAYSTRTAEMRTLNNTPDPKGTSGWSVLDMGRFLMGLHVIKTHYPEYADRINRIVGKWDLSKLIKDGWLQGGVWTANGQIRSLQEGRLGYEQYAANILKLWNLEATNALFNPPVENIQIDGISFQIDRRNLKNSGASNYLTNEPYLLWGLELGWPDAVKPQVENLLKVQAQRFNNTGILTSVSEASLDRPPYFLYYAVYANGQTWNAINIKGQAYPQLRFISTKAAFAWGALMQENPYAKRLRESVQNLATENRGYYSGRYENPRLGANMAVDVNTNAVILESLLYQARGRRPLAF